MGGVTATRGACRCSVKPRRAASGAASIHRVQCALPPRSRLPPLRKVTLMTDSRTQLDPSRLHVLTDVHIQDRFGHLELARLAAAGGADRVQYRDKRPLTTRELLAMASSIERELASTSCRLIVDDRADVALAVEAAGVHLGRDDLPVATARRMLGGDVIIGGTANSLEEARQVAATGVDYLGVGPIYGTRTKANPAPVMGLRTLAAIVEAVAIPVIAIGSITAATIGDVIAAGAYGVAVVSAVVKDDDPQAATARCRDAVDAALARRRA